MFLPWKLVYACSDIMRENLQEVDAKVSSISIPQNSVSEICDIFDNKVLPPSSAEQLRATATTYIVLDVFWTPLTNESKSQRYKKNSLCSVSHIL